MNRQKWSAWLEASIQDYRLDDSERRELQSELQDSVLSHEDRAYLRNMSFKLVQQEIQNQGDAAALVRWLERVVKVLDNVMSENSADTASSWFSPGRACASGIIEQLKLARHSVDICVFTIADNDLTDQILAAHKRGVTVRIVTDNDKMYDKGSDVEYLAAQGVAVKIDTTRYHMHHKFAIFDQQRLINGSFNWTRSASKYNQEDITLTDDRRFVSAFLRQFETLWQKFPCHKPS
ncbi:MULTISPECIES: phospholipase D-like domain-containing protein [Vibrio]|uniref:phospholipase D n=1 Tax=Vibrio campbellii TaxID=680 RepID=A0ABY5ILZ0_9VIBR|nr:phospholipase D-like domain-containing protein [Vibrio campbellii]MED5504986.1 phospholipase D-like domain-containing protein [Pseudomonadota bacterium]AXB33277.1 phosphatidylserine synthase [Vibrio campbellii]KGR36995.1 Phospholipase D precursor [Vibrio campbellii]RDX38322.1 phosphatidylserine synthase [Vibrio campbellii]UMM04869.1 phospholipase D-like domain-containing protein [Vibrio campbellii]|tara:strand:+ start:365 stop:1069 length:705 start_codon:yes stop_codon:yes gene_type:complete